MSTLPVLKIVSEEAAFADSCDGAIIIFTNKEDLAKILPCAKDWQESDTAFGETVQLVFPHDKKPYHRVVIAPTGSLYNDFDDARRFKDIAFEAGKRALKAGMKKPTVLFANPPGQKESLAWTHDDAEDYKYFMQVTMLGFLESCFEPINVREYKDQPAFDTVSFVSSVEGSENLIKVVSAIEEGRRVAIDIGSPDPERMAPIKIVEYLNEQFGESSPVKVTVKENEYIKENYPLAYAVSRASLAVERHHPRFVHLEYKSPDQTKVKENLYLVGKGVTYDTGGADIKCSGHMRGMSRDKCGAAAVAGFFKTIEKLCPETVNVTAGLALVRNSIGPDAYVSDEVIKARSGVRVLVGNTDAEGRMVMTDLLCEFKERVVKEMESKAPASDKPFLLFTVATLTGHAIRAYGGYGISLDNGLARKNKVSRRIHDAGHLLADPFEISTMRREDKAVVQPGRTCEDVVQANDQPSTMTSRGHQYPAGFMLIASGLDKHGLDSKTPIGYTHVDIAGSAETISATGWSLPRTTGSPVAALTGAFLLQ